jgi:hypothetical protein
LLSFSDITVLLFYLTRDASNSPGACFCFSK